MSDDRPNIINTDAKSISRYFGSLIATNVFLLEDNKLMMRNYNYNIGKLYWGLLVISLFCFYPETDKSVPFALIIGLTSILCAFCFVRKLLIYSIIDLEQKIVYRAFIFKNHYLYKTSPLKLSEIEIIGVNRIKKDLGRSRQSIIAQSGFKSNVSESNETYLTKRCDGDGLTECVVISFVTKDGKLHNFNYLSNQLFIEEEYAEVAKSIAHWLNIPCKSASTNKTLVPYMVDGKYSFNEISTEQTGFMNFVRTLWHILTYFALIALSGFVFYAVKNYYIYGKL